MNAAGGVSGAIMAGGRSRRLGQDKTTMPWPPGGTEEAGQATAQTLLEATAAKLAQVCDEVLLVGYRGSRPATYRVAPDLYAEGGSLGGLYSGLVAARHDYLLAVATDMPFLSLPLLRWMLAQPRDFDVLMPLHQDLAEEGTGHPAAGTPRASAFASDALEPLHAVYSKRCLEPMRRRLEAGRLKITGFFDDVRVRYVEERVLRAYDPEGWSFFNVNTPEDLDRARQILARPAGEA